MVSASVPARAHALTLFNDRTWPESIPDNIFCSSSSFRSWCLLQQQKANWNTGMDLEIWLDHNGRTFVNGITAFMRKPINPLCNESREHMFSKRNRPYPIIKYVGTLILAVPTISNEFSQHIDYSLKYFCYRNSNELIHNLNMFSCLKLLYKNINFYSVSFLTCHFIPVVLNLIHCTLIDEYYRHSFSLK